MTDKKTVVIYQNKDPQQPWVRFLAIQTETTPPYVWETYPTRHREDLPRLGGDMLVIPIEQASRLFEFKKGDLSDVVRD